MLGKPIICNTCSGGGVGCLDCNGAKYTQVAMPIEDFARMLAAVGR